MSTSTLELGRNRLTYTRQGWNLNGGTTSYIANTLRRQLLPWQPLWVRDKEGAVTVNVDRISQRELHPLHAVLLAGTVPLFLGGMLSDIAYANTYEIQWNNFASWLIAGGLVFNGLALLWALIDLVRAEFRGGLNLVYTLLLLLTWILGFINALIHAKDAWASMPTGLVLSVIVLVLACAATWLGFSKRNTGGGR